LRIDSGYQAYSQFVNYQRRDIPQVSLDEIKKQEQESYAENNKLLSNPIESSPVKNIEEVKASKVANLEDVSLSFKDNDLNNIGRDSDLFGLDVQKAVSDMKKDSILEEYQTFVGSANQFSFSNNDGSVIPKFNFDLL